MTHDKTPDEVQKLADALFDNVQMNRMSLPYAVVAREELRTLARDAAAVGARTALEDARRGLHDWGALDAGPDGAYFARLWEGKLIALKGKYTTDEEGS